MEQTTPTRRPKPGPEILLNHSSFLLSQRDFTNSRKYALLAQESDPNLSGPDQIIAVTNVLLAAERRLHNNHLDWYSILQIPKPGTRPEIHTQFQKLSSSLLNPINNNNNNKVPFIEEALKLVCDAWLVLSDTDVKTQYDNEINKENVNGYNPEKAEKTTEESDVNGTFWTVCPYCYHMFEYEKKYEERALRCQNCRRAFHGVAVPAPRQVEEGGRKEEFYCGVGLFPLGYKLSGGDYLGDKKAKSGDNVVEISDDSDEEEKGMNVESSDSVVDGEEAKEEVMKGVGERSEENVQVRNDGKRVVKKFKSVARKSKKIMGRGVKSRRIELMAGSRMGGVELGVEFGNGAGGNGNGIMVGSGSGNGNCGGRFEDKVEFF